MMGRQMASNEPEGARGGPAEPPAGEPSFTDRLNRLFELRCQQDGHQHSPMEFAKLILKETGVKVSHTWIWRLQQGSITNPSKQSLQTLARFFGVRPAYFFDEQTAEQAGAQLELLAAMGDAGVARVAALSRGLSPETLSAVAALLRDARKAQRLDEPASPTSTASPEPES
jgi:transcriptional regulator with XRE-family HTH domain